MKRKAFTIPELLIFLTIVGVISVLMITIIKPNEKYLKYAYYNMYYVLSTAGYNIQQDIDDDVNHGINAEFPSTARALCSRLATDPASANSNGYINTIQNNCTSFSSVNPSSASFSADNGKVAFIATNAMRFYISDMQTVSVNDPTIEGGGQTSLTYFIILVDLNGQRNPNNSEIKGKKAPDIVPFIMFRNGTVIPVGLPAYDTRYAMARIEYSAENRKGYSIPYSYYQAVVGAFGNVAYPATDLYSISPSVFALKHNLLKVPNSYIPTVGIDASCQPPAGDVTSPCSVVLEEMKSGFGGN